MIQHVQLCEPRCVLSNCACGSDWCRLSGDDDAWSYDAWCRIYASMNWVSIGSYNGLSPIRHQIIIQTNARLLSIGPLGTNVSEILIKIINFSFTKIHLKMSSAKWRPFGPGGWVKREFLCGQWSDVPHGCDFRILNSRCNDDVIKSKHYPRNWPFVWEFTGQFPAQSSVTRSFDFFFDLRLDKRLRKQSWGWWL